MGNCIHGMSPQWCALCNPRPQPKIEKRTPRPSRERTSFGSAALTSPKLLIGEYVLVKTHGGQKKTFDLISERTTTVHIDGHPYLWAIQRILEKAPNLKRIQTIPAMLRQVGEHHRRLCQERGVELVSGYHRPDLKWEEGRIVSPHYRAQKRFFQALSEEQKQLLSELLMMGFEFAHITVRYFCLKDEPFLPQAEIAAEYGYSFKDQSTISEGINSVMRYLDPTFEANPSSVRRALVMKGKVERLRERYGALLQAELVVAQVNQRLAELTGRQDAKMPVGLPLIRFETLEALIRASLDGSLARLKEKSEKRYQAVTLRFGFFDGTYRTLETVGKMMGGLTRERVRQLEEEALQFLNISEGESTQPLG